MRIACHSEASRIKGNANEGANHPRLGTGRRRTHFGRQVYLIGANRAAGRATGHENFGMAIKVCIIASVCAAFVAVAFSAQVSSAHVNYFSSSFGSSGDMTIMVIAVLGVVAAVQFLYLDKRTHYQ